MKDAAQVAEYRKQAEECFQRHSASTTPSDRLFWIRLADDWLQLALAAEKDPYEGPKEVPELIAASSSNAIATAKNT